ncbi:MAG: hypothetical protein QG656_2080 [Candidatus Hydrogenedentes bacterium]|nr:hypothetical protein [Candidatus Hydrogenedentota bacterium]
MKLVICPHCKTHRIVTARIPKDVVVVIPCPACHELVVLFRNKVVALSRKILEQGSREQRTTHIADIIEQFIEPGLFDFDGANAPQPGEPGFEAPPETDAEIPELAEFVEPITEQEMERFIQFELKRIDDPAYFKKYFG